MTKRQHILPPSLVPFGVGRDKAAALLDIGATLFDQLVAEGLLPQPRELKGRLVWDVDEVAVAFRAIPHRGETAGAVDSAPGDANPWD